MMIVNQFIAIKFQAPPLRPNRVQRPRLICKLEDRYQTGSRLTVICAPAGYGKTTLAVEWLQQEKKSTWLNLDEAENDPIRFFMCLVTALQKIDPHMGLGTLSLLSIPQPPSPEIITGELINDISLIDQPFFLVLDDYHNIRTPQIHDALEFLVNNQPPNLHLVITTREDPAFPLGRLRASGQITEIRARDLRFTLDEIRSFLAIVHKINLPDPALQKLLQITEGWAAGLQLTGLAFQNEEDAEDFFDSFNGKHQYIIEYLLEEVLRRQPEEIQQFLSATSILSRFNSSLCAALVGDQVKTDEFLAYLEKANLFLTPLDSTHEWFRYHRLFADVLITGLDSKIEADLHLRAAQWFCDHALPSEAIPHYLAAGEVHDASRLIRDLSGDLIKNGELHTFLNWIQHLPEEEIRSDPGLLAVQALALLLTGEITRAASILQSFDFSSTNNEGIGPLLAVKAWFLLVSGGNENLQGAAQQALSLLTPDQTIFRVISLLALGTGYLVNFNIGASTEAFYEAYSLGIRMQNPFAAAAGLANLAYNYLDMGQLQKAKNICLEMISRYTDAKGKPFPILGLVYMPMSSIYLELFDLVKAKEYAQKGKDLCQKLFSSGMAGGDAEIVLSIVAFYEGDSQGAFDIIESMLTFASERHITFLEDKMVYQKADLLLREGATKRAQITLNQLEIQGHAFNPAVSFSMRMLRIQILAVEGQTAAALTEIDQLEPVFRQGLFIRRLILLLTIKSLILDEAHMRGKAIEALGEAVRLAAPNGYFITLLRRGHGLISLLPEVRETAPAYIDELISYLTSSSMNASEGENAPASIPSRVETAGLIEPLSPQEIIVLQLVTAGLSNQEIAERLVISPGTAKWHVHNILSKLGAGSRTQAAVKARELGLI